MKVILTSDVYKHGVAGEVVVVADGFARNHLIPKGLAVKATPAAIQESAELRETVVVRKAALEDRLNDLARQIDGVELVFGRRAGSNGKLYGSVTTMDVANALMEKTTVDINRRRISQIPLREIGEHEVPVRLGSEITPVLKIVIVREEELQAYLDAQAAADAEPEAEAVDLDEAPELAAEQVQAAIAEAEAAVVTLDDEAAEGDD